MPIPPAQKERLPRPCSSPLTAMVLAEAGRVVRLAAHERRDAADRGESWRSPYGSPSLIYNDLHDDLDTAGDRDRLHALGDQRD
jgi:hypothetical protein